MANLDYISHQIIATVNGTPIPGAKINYYLTGTTTPQNTFSDAGLTAPNANPVICDANGVVPEVYLAATRYKRAVTDASNVSLPQYDVDPLDASQELISLAALPSPTYPFLRVANTADGITYRRNAANSAWISEGLTDALVNAATITDQLTGTSAILSSTPDSVAALWQRGADIASAATISLPATGGGVFNITGTVGVTSISSAQGGRSVKLRFAGALTLTHNGTSLILPGAANITTVAGDVAEFINEGASDASGSNWRCFNYQRADGSSVTLTSNVAAQADQETATSVSLAVTPGRQHFHPGHPKAGVNYNGTGTAAIRMDYGVTSLADNGTGLHTMTFDTAFSSTNYWMTGWARDPGSAGTICTATTGGTKTTTTFQIATTSDAGAAADSSEVGAFWGGDQ